MATSSGIPPAEPTRGSISTPDGLPIDSLTMEEIGAANRQAQIDGIGVGACAGFIGSFLSTKVFRQSRNVGLLSGLLTATATGYFFTQAALEAHLAAASKNASTLRAHLSNSPNNTTSPFSTQAEEDRLSGTKYWSMDKQGGSQGLEELEDKYATTRGDH